MGTYIQNQSSLSLFFKADILWNNTHWKFLHKTKTQSLEQIGPCCYNIWAVKPLIALLTSFNWKSVCFFPQACSTGELFLALPITQNCTYKMSHASSGLCSTHAFQLGLSNLSEQVDWGLAKRREELVKRLQEESLKWRKAGFWKEEKERDWGLYSGIHHWVWICTWKLMENFCYHLNNSV